MIFSYWWVRERQRNREGRSERGTYTFYYTSAFLLPRLLPHGNSFIASGRVQWTGSLITASSDGNRAPTILPLLERLFSEGMKSITRSREAAYSIQRGTIPSDAKCGASKSAQSLWT